MLTNNESMQGVTRIKPQSNPQESPIIFVHGAWHGSWCWKDGFAAIFADAGYDCYLIDLPGHGDNISKKSLFWLSIEDYVNYLENIVSRIGNEKPILIGHSMGGFIIQKYLENHPAKAGILLASIPPKGLPTAILTMAQLDLKGALIALLTMDMSLTVFKKETIQNALFNGIPDDKFQKYYLMLQKESYRAFLDFTLLKHIDVEKVNTPLLVIGAELDKGMGNAVEKTAEAYHTKAKIYPAMPHEIMFAEGNEKVAHDAIEWLASLEKKAIPLAA